MKRLKLYLFINLMLLVRIGYSQNRDIDSLLKLLKQDKNDTTKVKRLNRIAWMYSGNNPDTALILSTQALDLSEQLNWETGVGQSHLYMGIYLYFKGQYPASVSEYLKSIEAWERLEKVTQPNKFLSNKSLATSNIGLCYSEQGDYPKALEFYFKAIAMEEKLGNNQGVAESLINIGSVYLYQGDFAKALSNYNKALKVEKAKQNIAIILDNIGNVYLGKASSTKNMNRDSIVYYLNKALPYYNEALKLDEEEGNKTGIARHFGNIGNAYNELGDYTKAKEYAFKALAIDKEIANTKGMAILYLSIGEVYKKEKKYKEAGEFLLKSLELAKEIGILSTASSAENFLSDLYFLTGNYEKALAYYKQHRASKDSLFNEEKNKELTRYEMNYEFKKNKRKRERNKIKKTL